MKSISSSSRLFLVATLIAMLAQGAFAHTYLSSVYLNNAALAEGDCVRPHPATAFDSPIPFVTAPDMTCGWLPSSANPANRKCPIAAGSTMGIQWHHQSNAPTDDIVDPSHVGPIMFYLAKSDTGAGPVWFKIYEDGYTASDGKWAVNRLLDNKGRVDFTIPSDIAPGNYLLRGELIALHGANALNGVQPYVGCVELTISGSGNANPSGVALPGAYSQTDPGMLFDLYSPYTSYIIPGPAVYTPGSKTASSGSNSAPSSGSSSTNPTTKPPTNPPTNPTNPPSQPPPPPPSNGAGISVQLSGGSSAWWVGVMVAGASETTVKVEIMDSGSVTTWASLVDMSYAYIYEAHAQLKAPMSIRLTSSSGKQVTLTNVFTSFATSLINTGLNFGGSATTPTKGPSAPATQPPSTGAPSTGAPSTGASSGSSSGSSVKVTQNPGNGVWWFAVAVSGNSGAISKVEIKDSGAVSAYTAMASNSWGYSYSAQGGHTLVAPVTVRITSGTKQVTATFTTITPNLMALASGQL